MSKLNKSLVNDLQSMTFEEKLEDSYKTIDFNYLGFNKANPQSKLIKYGKDANINRVLFWLSSKKNDYVREPEKGGLLYSLLGTITSEDNLEEVEDRFKNIFNEEFFNMMDLIMVKLLPDKRSRKLIIYLVVFDKITMTTFSLNTEASL